MEINAAYDKYNTSCEARRRISTGAGSAASRMWQDDDEQWLEPAETEWSCATNAALRDRQFWQPNNVVGKLPRGATHRGFANQHIIHSETDLTRQGWKTSERKNDIDLTARVCNQIPQDNSRAFNDVIYKFR